MQTALIPDEPGPDEPIPYTLTPKAEAFLDLVDLAARHASVAVVDGALYLRPALVESVIDGVAAWACSQCGAAWFGPLPDDGLCPDCVPGYRVSA